MNEFEKDIKELYDSIYLEEPSVGDWVILKNEYHETIITGEVVALKHTSPNRGFHPEADFEFVVWSSYKLKLAAVKGWFPMDKWELLTTMPDFENKKLPRRKRED